MLQCPVCGRRINTPGEDQWFQCPGCRNWLCQRMGPNASAWLEAGVQANNRFYAVSINNRDGQRNGPAREASQPRVSQVPPEQMSLQEVQSERQNIAEQLRVLPERIQAASNEISQNSRDPGRVTRLNSDIARYNELQNRLRHRDQTLAARETRLQQQQPVQRRTMPNDRGGTTFGCSFGLVAAAIIAFSIYIHFTWNLQAAFAALIISLIGAVILLFAAS